MRWVLVSVLCLASGPAMPQVFPTPKWIDRCEKAVADLIMHPADKAFSETEARSFAVTLYGCDERRLLDRSTKNMIDRSAIKPYLDAYSENPDVWRAN